MLQTILVGALLLVLALTVWLLFRARQPSTRRPSRPLDPSLRPGTLCSVVTDQNRFGVAKILVIDDHGYHVRLYGQTFPTRPADVDESSLTLGAIDDPRGQGIGHLPLSPETFASWEPVPIKPSTVAEDELEGYELWKESGGDVW